MSHRATTWAYAQPLTSSLKAVLVALADDVRDGGDSCYPGQGRLVTKTGLSESTIRRALTRLTADGLITREHRYDRRGYRTSDLYTLIGFSQGLPVTATGRPVVLPVTVTAPTGHHDRYIEEEPEGRTGRGAPPTPDPVDNSIAAIVRSLDSGTPSPFCPRHPEGTSSPCAGCKNARIAWEATLTPTRTNTIPRIGSWDPAVHCEHHGLLGACEICELETARAARWKARA